MKPFSSYILICSVLYASANADGNFAPYFADTGYCADTLLVEDFNFHKFSGEWVVMQEVSNSYAQDKYCSTVNIEATDNEFAYTIRRTGLDTDFMYVSQSALLTQMDYMYDYSYLELNSSNAPSVTYDVIATDYDSYACVYSCLNVMIIRVELFSIFTREKTQSLPNSIRETCYNVFQEMGISTEKLSDIDHNNVTCNANSLNPEMWSSTTKSQPPTKSTPKTIVEESDVFIIDEIIITNVKDLQLESQNDFQQHKQIVFREDYEVLSEDGTNQAPQHTVSWSVLWILLVLMHCALQL